MNDFPGGSSELGSNIRSDCYEMFLNLEVKKTNEHIFPLSHSPVHSNTPNLNNFTRTLPSAKNHRLLREFGDHERTIKDVACQYHNNPPKNSREDDQENPVSPTNLQQPNYIMIAISCEFHLNYQCGDRTITCCSFCSLLSLTYA